MNTSPFLDILPEIFEESVLSSRRFLAFLKNHLFFCRDLGYFSWMLLDSRDCQLLALLQKDCRISNADLAQRVGMSSSACWRRVRVFEEAGLISQYRAELSPEHAGLSFQALVHVHLTRHNPEHLERFIAAIEKRPEVMECYATTGQADYHMRVICKDIGAYNVFLEEFLFRLPAVESAQTNVVLREIKRSNALPIPSC